MVKTFLAIFTGVNNNLGWDFREITETGKVVRWVDHKIAEQSPGKFPKFKCKNSFALKSMYYAQFTGTKQKSLF